jgi:acetyltransferase-like isoleucine patch superfamily enzyme
MSGFNIAKLTRRLWWDILDPDERKYLLYFFISGIPGLFGNMLRGRFVSKRVVHCGINLTVLAGTRFRSIENLKIGDNVSIGYDNFIQARGGVTIGNDVMTAPGVKIWSVNHNVHDPDVLIRNQPETKAEVVIGNDVFIASNVFVLPGVTLPDGVVVTAGSVVGVKAYKPYSIIAGNPARMIGFRGGKLVE